MRSLKFYLLLLSLLSLNVGISQEKTFFQTKNEDIVENYNDNSKKIHEKRNVNLQVKTMDPLKGLKEINFTTSPSKSVELEKSNNRNKIYLTSKLVENASDADYVERLRQTTTKDSTVRRENKVELKAILVQMQD